MAVIVALACAGCTRSHVAAFSDSTADATGGSASSGVTSTTTGSSASRGGTTGGFASSSTSSAGASTGLGSCELPPRLPGCDDAADPLRALEVACFDDVSAAEFRSVDDDAWRRAHEFGNAFWVSEESAAILVLSTGRLPQTNAAEQVDVSSGAAELEAVDNDNPNGATLPEPMVATVGSAAPYVDCDGIGDCSHTLDDALVSSRSVSDLLWLRFSAKVPDDAVGYSVKVGFLSAQYPEGVGAADNAMFVWWSAGELFTGNLATWNGNAATVTGLADRLAPFTGGHPILMRTGFDGTSRGSCPRGERCPVGATTGWMTLRGPAVPGETLDIAAALFEQSPEVGPETVVVLDDWRWSCNRCVLGETCGLQ